MVTLLLVTGAPVAGAALYLMGLALASTRYEVRLPRLAPEQHPRVLVLIPAHDEQELIARCLFSLTEQTYPAARLEVVVVADNSTDGTADIATAFDARVLVRHDTDHVGKGHALRWAIDRLLSDGSDFDAVVIVDADSVCDRRMIEALVEEMTDGAPAVQAEYLALDEPGQSTGATLRSLGFLLFHRVRFRGRAALGLPCHLVGNGMLFTRRLLQERPWSAFTGAEDLEYSVDLRLAGVGVRFAGAAGVKAPLAGTTDAADTQRARWEGGRWHVVRTRLPLLGRSFVFRRRLDLLDELVELAVPPLGLLATAAVGGSLLAGALTVAGAATAISLVPWLLALVAVAAYVLVGMLAGDATRASYSALKRAPLLVVSTLGSRLRAVRGFDPTAWVRTPRPNESTSTERAVVAGVPIDTVGLADVVERAHDAVRDGRFLQICTVNLDFLVNARRQKDVAALLRTSELNVADGAPVVWLTRLLGRRMIGRVAGADLVPALCHRAERAGHRVFLLGGENGSAERAAAALVRRYPKLQIAGLYEPPRASIEQLDSRAMLQRIDEAEADIVLVAFGHPKQDRWIGANREHLTANVAIGVGCTFDLLAGDRQRAPGWMQAHGLEWLFRMVNEPRRLGRRYLVDAWWLAVVFVPGALLARLRSAAEHA